MTSQFEQEMRVGAMIRSISQAVRDSYKDHIDSLYADKEGKLTGYRECCARWHWNLLVSGHNMDKVQEYIAAIQDAFINEKNLDEDEDWSLLMRLFLPTQFIKKVETFSQVPRLAIMDPSSFNTKDSVKRKPLFSDIRMG